jgi:hypothetical protein
MIVVLIYGNQGDPATLVIHGQDGKTWLSLSVPVNGHGNQHLEVTIRRTLMPHRANLPSSIEVAHEARTRV